MRHALNPTLPELHVQLRVDPNVMRAHRLLRKLHDALDGPRSALLERTAVHTLVQVDRVFARYDVSERGTLSGL